MLDHRSLKKSFGYAFEGIYYSIKYNQNLRIHFLFATIVILTSIYFHVSAFEASILGVMIVLVISAEMVNTAIEEMTNLIIKEHRQEAKIAKDVSAGMVLVTVVGSIIVGLLIFMPYVVELFDQFFSPV